MNPVRSFRISLYITLALAILSVGVAGGDLLPEIPYITILALIMLGAAYRIEGRWELSLRNANIVGFGLFALLALWAVFQAVRPPTGLMETLPWPASALPYMAPVVMLLIPAKLFRPKHIGDYWAMQGLGVLAMALACAMTSEGLFVLLFGLYAAVFTWNLTSFFLYRETGHEDTVPMLLAPMRWRDWRTLLGWAVVACAVAVPLFWVTPRGNTSWELGINVRGRASTGLGDGQVDLNRTGTIDVVRDKVFEIYATDANGEPVLDLPGDLHWRTEQRQQYENGRWARGQNGSITVVDRAVPPKSEIETEHEAFPNLGDQAVKLRYTLTNHAGKTTPIASPVAWRTLDYAPLVSRTLSGKNRNWVHMPDSTFTRPANVSDERNYVQWWAAAGQQGYGPPMRVEALTVDRLGLTRLPRELDAVKKYTDDVLKQAVEQGQIHAAALTEIDNITRGRVRQYHEPIARLLEQHLNANPAFHYSLELTRNDRSLDPIVDFLLNTKMGHCQRYATALVLMLRSQGITAQLVLGYRGCEAREGEPGRYDVYSSHAHAWVEVLVPAPDVKLPPLIDHNQKIERTGNWITMRWVTLDPTPGGDLVEAGGGFFEQAKQRWESILRLFVLTYNAELREEAMYAVRDWFLDEGGYWWLVGIVVGVFALRQLRRWWRSRVRRPADHFPAEVRLLVNCFHRRGLEQATGQTLQEYFLLATTTLQPPPTIANIPDQVLKSYYAERFGGQATPPEQRQTLLAAVERFIRELPVRTAVT